MENIAAVPADLIRISRGPTTRGLVLGASGHYCVLVPDWDRRMMNTFASSATPRPGGQSPAPYARGLWSRYTIPLGLGLHFTVVLMDGVMKINLVRCE